MKLNEYLNNLDEATSVKIGFEGGSSFVYCGEGNQNVADILTAEEQRQKRYLSVLLYRQTNTLKKHKAKYAEWRECHVDDNEVLAEKVKNAEDAVKATNDELNRRPFEFMERDVVETYESIVTPNQIIVILSGIISGKYWDVEEFNARKG